MINASHEVDCVATSLDKSSNTSSLVASLNENLSGVFVGRVLDCMDGGVWKGRSSGARTRQTCVNTAIIGTFSLRYDYFISASIVYITKNARHDFCDCSYMDWKVRKLSYQSTSRCYNNCHFSDYHMLDICSLIDVTRPLHHVCTLDVQ